MKSARFWTALVEFLLVSMIAVPGVSAATLPSISQFTWINQEDEATDCGYAVAQMITNFYHNKNPSAIPRVFSQQEIRNKMVANIPRNEVDRYYKAPFADVGIGKTNSDYFYARPDWDNVVITEINADRPFKIGIRYPQGNLHALAVVGYREVGGVKELYVFNPAENHSSPEWLNYDTTTFTNYIVVK